MNTSNFSAAARKEAIRQLKYRGDLYKQAWVRYWDKYNTMKQVLLEDHARSAAGSQFIDELAAAQVELDELRSALSVHGFDFHDGVLSLSRHAPEGLNVVIQKEITNRIGISDDDIVLRFDNARIAMLTAQNYDDAEKIMQSIRELIN